jgi:hypothetical protein
MGIISLKRNFFEGWYFKQTNGEETIAFIPSYHVDNKGHLLGSLQVIVDNNAYALDYHSNEFEYVKKPFLIILGGCRFSLDKIIIDIDKDNLKVNGELYFSGITPPHYDIMGPLKYAPLLECRHGLLSFKHSVNGTLTVNGKRYDFVDTLGYIERDSGRSFPDRYLWTQANIDPDTSVMLSIATVKTLGISFTGTVCAVYHNHTEYRLASYLGAKVVKFSDTFGLIKQGDYTFSAEQLTVRPLALNAPENGIMKRVIKESAACKVRYRFVKDDTTLLDIIATTAGFEYSCKNDKII